MEITLYHSEWGENRPIRGVLFDMDGLVLDSETLFTRFWREAANLLGYPMTVEPALYNYMDEMTLLDHQFASFLSHAYSCSVGPWTQWPWPKK